MHCSALPEGPLAAKDVHEEKHGATILVTAVTELPLQLPLVQKNTGTQHWRKEHYHSLASRV